MTIAITAFLLTLNPWSQADIRFGSVFPDKRAPVSISVAGKAKAKYEVPNFARVKCARFDAEKGTLKIGLRGSLPKILGYMSIEAYFQDGKGKNLFIAMPLGLAHYKTPGQAWAFGPSPWHPNFKVQTDIGPDWFQFNGLKPVAQGRGLFMVLVRYLPASIDVHRVSGGTSSIIADVWVQGSKRRNGGFFPPIGPPL